MTLAIDSDFNNKDEVRFEPVIYTPCLGSPMEAGKGSWYIISFPMKHVTMAKWLQAYEQKRLRWQSVTINSLTWQNALKLELSALWEVEQYIPEGICWLSNGSSNILSGATW